MSSVFSSAQQITILWMWDRMCLKRSSHALKTSCRQRIKSQCYHISADVDSVTALTCSLNLRNNTTLHSESSEPFVHTSNWTVCTQEHLGVQTQTVCHHSQHPQTQLFTALIERRLDLLEPGYSTWWPFLKQRRTELEPDCYWTFAADTDIYFRKFY